MDETVEKQLLELNLPSTTIVPIREVETKELLSVKTNRSIGEYCWTLTPFTPQIVFDRAPQVKRATYIDADLFFFSSPEKIFRELEAIDKDVLITEHAYAKEYDQTATSGRFCVQFMTFNNNTGGKRVLHWWQDRCLEWCYARYEDGKFGDQMYLNDWPTRFENEVHVLDQRPLAMGPWNARSFFDENYPPVFYHFHGLRVLSPEKVILYAHYKIGKAKRLYTAYLSALKVAFALMQSKHITIPTMIRKQSTMARAKLFINQLIGRVKIASI